MPGCWSPIILTSLIRIRGRRSPSREAQISTSLIRSPSSRGHEPHTPIHTLNDDVLMNVFYLYLLDVQDEDEDENGKLKVHWDRQRWWYKPAQVCRQWRHLILASPSHLNLHLICTYGVPVADMLACSPPLPVTIYYWDKDRETTAEDEEGILLALRQCSRVRHICFALRTPNLRKSITAMDVQFPILERMYVKSRTEEPTSLVFPRTFQAPNLRHLKLFTASLAIGSPLLTTTAGLVTLILENIPPFPYLPPRYFLIRLSLMRQLEDLVIHFHSPLPNRDVGRPLSHIPNMTQVILPNLRRFWFQGTGVYLEGLVARISAPVLSGLHITFFNQLPFATPWLLQFMRMSENLGFRAIWLDFLLDGFVLSTERQGKSTFKPFLLMILCKHPDLQVSSAVQILSALQPVITVAEQLTLGDVVRPQSSDWHNKVTHTQWRELLRLFRNVETLHVQNELVGEVSRSLQSDDEEPPLRLLPDPTELGYSGGNNARDAYTSFVVERQAEGHLVWT
jgi:hypothetical protein